MDSNEQINQVPVQQSSPVVEPAITTESVVGEKSHLSTFRILVVLLIAAAILFIIVGAASTMRRDTEQYMPEDTAGMMVEDDTTVPSTTQEESDSIRADLEANSTDGTSEAL